MAEQHERLDAEPVQPTPSSRTERDTDAADEGPGPWKARLASLRSSTQQRFDALTARTEATQQNLGDTLRMLAERVEALERDFGARLPPLAEDRAHDPARVEAGLARLQLLSRVLDDLVRIPLTDKRIGLDPFLDRVPLIGRYLPGAVAIYSVTEAAALGAPPELLLRMLGRHVLNIATARIPVAGPFLNAMFKANTLNLDDLVAHFETTLDDLETAADSI